MLVSRIQLAGSCNLRNRHLTIATRLGIVPGLTDLQYFPVDDVITFSGIISVCSGMRRFPVDDVITFRGTISVCSGLRRFPVDDVLASRGATSVSSGLQVDHTHTCGTTTYRRHTRKQHQRRVVETQMRCP